MKKSIKLISTGLILLISVQSLNAQILNRIKDRAKQKVEDKIIDETEKATDKGLDEVENTVSGSKKEKPMNDNPKKDGKTSSVANLQNFKNYDFVPGDKLIYHYDMEGEKDSEIPGRMILNRGNAEIQSYQNEKVLAIPAPGEIYMAPLMKNNAYLPEQFTLEFDVLTNGNSNTDGSEITLYFRERERAGSGDATAPVRISLSVISGIEGQAHYGFEIFKNDNWSGTASKPFPSQAQNSKQNNWRHVSIYINKNIGKLYIDEHRLAVVNQIEDGKINMVEIEVRNDANPVLFKNFRIASGGDDAYKKVISEGKFIAYGIQFDVNKATLKPESMGTINEFVKMMKENSSLNFEIGGHTDSDGTTKRNDELSQERAETVKLQMVKGGVDANRLTTKGYGSSKPVVANDNPENKARNRRVEFVKL